MSVIGDGIGAGMGILGGIFGGVKASQAMKNVRANVDEQRRRNKDWYNRYANEDVMQRADVQAVLSRLDEDVKNRNKAAEGTAAVMGGSEESVAAAKAANARSVADTMSAVGADAAKRRDAVEAQYMAKEDALDAQLNDMEMRKAAQIGVAAGEVAKAGSKLGDVI